MTSIIPQDPKAYFEEYAQVRAMIRKRFERETKGAGFWRRFLLRWRIEREVEAEMEKRFPRGALYCK